MSAITTFQGPIMPTMWVNTDILTNVLILVLVIGITFIQNIPLELKKFSNTYMGSYIGIVITYIIYTFIGFPTALLFSLLFLLSINSSILHNDDTVINERFEPGIDTRIIQNSKKWYIEKILGENPIMIEEDNVKTQAVQDSTSGSRNSL